MKKNQFCLLILTLLSCTDNNSESIVFIKERIAMEETDNKSINVKSHSQMNDTIRQFDSLFVPLIKLPPTKLKSEFSFSYFEENFVIPKERMIKNGKTENFPYLYQHNYCFDTIINNCKMHFVEHRVSNSKETDQLILVDLNFMIELLQSLSCENRYFSSENQALDFGEMIFYSHVDKVDNKGIHTKFISSYFSGGGSSTKVNIRKTISVDDFYKLMEVPLSSAKIFEIFEAD